MIVWVGGFSIDDVLEQIKLAKDGILQPWEKVQQEKQAAIGKQKPMHILLEDVFGVWKDLLNLWMVSMNQLYDM